MRILGVIPARYGSSRLPGKVLLDIGGRSMVARVIEQARRSAGLAAVVVATDDERVAGHVRGLNAEVVMTSADHPSGTDRCYEALAKVGRDRYDAVVNIQGDEPFLDPAQLDLVCATLERPGVQVATLAKAVTDDRELDDPGEAHLVVDKDLNALYFSRAAIPFLRDEVSGPRHRAFPFLKHVGVYGYRSEVLERLVALPPSPLERAERLEQLRWLENGFRITVALTDHDSFCVDTEADLAEARRRAAAS